LAKKALCA